MTARRDIALPRARYWGDLIADPATGVLLLPLRRSPAEVVCVDVDGAISRRTIRTSIRDARLRLLHPAGYWLVTLPSDPMALHAVDSETGAVRWRIAIPGRFDPDTRLALAIDQDWSILVAGCGYPCLLRFEAQGRLIQNLYELQDGHSRDFAWRGVVAVVPGPGGCVYLVDRNMYGVVLAIDAEQGHRGDLGQREAQTMTLDAVGLNEPCWAVAEASGGLWVLELGVPRWTRFDAAGVVQAHVPLPAMPWHYLTQQQGIRWQHSLVTFHARPDRLVLIDPDVRDSGT